jgi:heme/copper-type cytochrome/quinol oxidase subunit 2
MSVRSVLFWVAAACCVLAELAILRSLLFGRARDAEQQHAEQPSRVSRTTRPAEIAWALLPALGLLFVLYLTWRAVDQSTAPPSTTSRIGATIGD